MSKPILLLQWLKPGEYRETRKALAEFAATVDIEHADVQKKDEAKKAFDHWLATNAGNTQFPFIGGHGIEDAGTMIGIGASGSSDEHATWDEIWQWMIAGTVSGGLWLGGCRTADAAAALSVLLAKTNHTVIRYIVGFSESIYPSEIENVLRQLLKNTDTDRIVYIDAELELIRKAVPNTKVVMFYPAMTKAGVREYVNVDDFEAKVGVSFSEFLKRRG